MAECLLQFDQQGSSELGSPIVGSSTVNVGSPIVGFSIVCSHVGVLLASSLDIPCKGLTTAKETVYQMLAKTKMYFQEF